MASWSEPVWSGSDPEPTASVTRVALAHHIVAFIAFPSGPDRPLALQVHKAPRRKRPPRSPPAEEQAPKVAPALTSGTAFAPRPPRNTSPPHHVRVPFGVPAKALGPDCRNVRGLSRTGSHCCQDSVDQMSRRTVSPMRATWSSDPP